MEDSDPFVLVMAMGYTYAYLFSGKVGAILYNRLHLYWWQLNNLWCITRPCWLWNSKRIIYPRLWACWPIYITFKVKKHLQEYPTLFIGSVKSPLLILHQISSLVNCNFVPIEMAHWLCRCCSTTAVPRLSVKKTLEQHWKLVKDIY